MTEDKNNIGLLIAGQVKIARRKRRITQTDAGAKLGVSFQQFQKYENGKSKISALDLLRLSLYFDKHLDFFYRDARAVLTNNPRLSSYQQEEARNLEDRTIYKYGLTINDIVDENFRAGLLRLAKRHTKLCGNTGDE